VSDAEAFEPLELAPGLWRWTADHPRWDPRATPGSTGDWGPRVGCVLVLGADTATFIDALVPADSAPFWGWADQLVAGAAECHALTTIGFHRRSRDELVERYGARTSRAREALPAGVEKRSLRGAGEVAYWLSGQRALVLGDRVLGDGRGGLRLCPESWIAYLGNGLTIERLRELLRPLLELPVARVLVSHGDPVLADGRTALAKAIRC